MAYSHDEMAPLKSKIQSALEGDRLSNWQRQFLIDIEERIERYGRDVRFSDKQITKLYEILSSPAKRSAQNSPPQPTQRTRIASFGHSRHPPAIRKLGRTRGGFAKRTVLDIAMLAILMIAAFLYVGYQRLPLPNLGISFSQMSPAYEPRAITMSEFEIIDGDTIRFHSESRGTRLVGFNAPETIKPLCDDEEVLGRRAKARLRELLSRAALELERVACSCAPGTEGTDACNHGRRCAILRADGIDVGQVLINEGLAAPLICGATRCPPTPRPWCG